MYLRAVLRARETSVELPVRACAHMEKTRLPRLRHTATGTSTMSTSLTTRDYAGYRHCLTPAGLPLVAAGYPRPRDSRQARCGARWGGLRAEPCPGAAPEQNCTSDRKNCTT